MATGEMLHTSASDETARDKRDLEEIAPLDDLVDYVKAYAREKPETAALICIGVGFVLGWKLKPW